MKTILTHIILLLFVPAHVYGQSDTVFVKYNKGWDDGLLSYETDTAVFDSHFKNRILYGTMVLPWTTNQVQAKGYGISLDSVSVEECKKGIEGGEDRILSVINAADSLIVEIELVGNCCHSFLCDVIVQDGKTINLINYGYGTYCSCVCIYHLTYYFSKLDEALPFEDIIINNNPKTRRLF